MEKLDTLRMGSGNARGHVNHLRRGKRLYRVYRRDAGPPSNDRVEQFRQKKNDGNVEPRKKRGHFLHSRRKSRVSGIYEQFGGGKGKETRTSRAT